MSDEFLFDYVLLVLFSVVGVIQIVAARSSLLGLMFLRPWRCANQWLGSMLVVAAFAWYTIDESRNIPDTAGGLDGNTQALWFSLSAGAGVGVTFLLSSVINHRWAVWSWDPTAEIRRATGISELEHTTFALAIAHQVRVLLKGGR